MKKGLSFLLLIALLLSTLILPVFAVPSTATSEEKTGTQAEAPQSTPENEFVSFGAQEAILRKTNAENIAYTLQLNSSISYDYAIIRVAATENLTLASYEAITLPYGEENVTLRFSVNNLLSPLPLDYLSTAFDEILVKAILFRDDKSIQTAEISVSVLPTSANIFVGCVGKRTIFEEYADTLKEDGTITVAEHKAAVKSCHELTHTIPTSEFNQTENLEKLKTPIQQNKVFKQFNETTQKVEKLESILSTEEALSGPPTLRALSTEYAYDTNILVTLKITALNGGYRLQLQGMVLWTDVTTDISGVNSLAAFQAISHPAGSIQIQVMEDNGDTDTVITTIYTATNGSYNTTIDNILDSSENGRDIYLKVNMGNHRFSVVTGTNGKEYNVTTGITYDIKTTQAEKSYLGSDREDPEAYDAISIAQAMAVGYRFYEHMNNNNVGSPATVHYYNPEAKEGNYYSGNQNITIGKSSYCNWDPIIHELGHLVADNIGVTSSFAQEHILNENLSERYGKELGINGGWSEGWASYFSMAAQNYYDKNVFNISDIYCVADNMYAFLSFEHSESTNITQLESLNVDYITQYGFGEGNEFAVTAALLYMAEEESLDLGYQWVWNTARLSGCSTFYEFMIEAEDDIFYTDASIWFKIGKVLEKHNFVDAPDFSKSSLFSRYTQPTFYWNSAKITDNIATDSNGTNFNNHVYYNQSKLPFYNKNFEPIYETAWMNSSTGTGTEQKSMTLSYSAWSTILSGISGSSFFYWGISTCQEDAPYTGPYYSSLFKGVLTEDIQQIYNLDTSYPNYVNADSEVWYSFTAPQSGTYDIYTTGSFDSIGEIYTSDKFVTPVQTDDQSGDDNNFKMTRYLSAGSKIYICVKGYAGASGTSNIRISLS